MLPKINEESSELNPIVLIKYQYLKNIGINIQFSILISNQPV